MRELKVKKCTLIWILTMFCVLYECKYFSVLGIASNVLFYARQFSYIIMFLFCLTNNNARLCLSKYKGFLRIYLFGLVFLGAVEVVQTISVGGLSLHDTLSNLSGTFLKFLVVFPILYLMECYSFDTICADFSRVCLVILILQAVVAVTYNVTGQVVMDKVIRSEEALRNGMIRVSSTCLTWFVVVYNIFRWQNHSSLKVKTIALAEWIFGVLYMVFVNQSRSQYIAIIASVVMMILFNKRRAKKQLFIVTILLVIIIVFLQSDLFLGFMESFSKNAADDTLTVRMYKLQAIYNAFRQHPYLGYGFVGATISLSSSLTSLFYFIDYGFIGDYIQYGLVAVYLYLCMIIRMIVNIKWLSRCGDIRFNLMVGMLAFLVVGMIGFTLLDSSRNFAIPVIWAITEYLRYSDEDIDKGEFEQRENYISENIND